MLSFRTFLLCGAVLVATGQAGAAPRNVAAPAGQRHQADINRNGAIILIRSALVALDQANKTGNYTVLRDLAAPGFQKLNSPARLAEIFAGQRQNGLDLSGVAAIDPQLNALPAIEANGMLSMVGFFPSVPQQINFELLFSPVEGQWKLNGISVKLESASPTAPQTERTAPAPTEAAPPPQPSAPSASATPAQKREHAAAPRKPPAAPRVEKPAPKPAADAPE